VWIELKDYLESSRRSILEEIRSYPPPIAGCDLQFNYLLEQRELVSGELSRLACVRRDTAGTYVEGLKAFISASACIDDALKARLTLKLKVRFAEER
jgi:hypothetical protein